MTSQLVSSTIRRSNRLRLILSVLGLLAVLVAGVLSMRYLTNFVLGPRDITASELLTLEDPNTVDRYWVNASGDDVYETGIEEITTGRYGRESVTAKYHALLVDDRLLLVATDDETTSMRYSGGLIPIDDEVRTDVIDYVETEADIQGAFLPYMLDAQDFRFPGYIGLGVAAVITLLSLYGLATTLQRADPAKHPLMRRLARHGDTASTVSDLENEMLAPSWSQGALHTTRNWLVQAAPRDFNAMRLNEIVWVYKQVTQRRVNGVPAGKMFAAHIRDSHGHTMQVAAKKEQAADLLVAGVHNAAPWALVGYNEEIEKAWKSDRAAVVNAVAQRRQQAVAEA